MKTIICYCTSGLGNRLRPLASAYVFAKETNRKLLVYWDNITPNGCLAKFNELFTNKIDMITLDELGKLNNVLLFTEKGSGHGVQREQTLFKRDALATLAKQNQPRQATTLVNTEHENIIVYDNDFAPIANRTKCNEFIRSLTPVPEIQSTIDQVTAKLKLSKEIIGAHARGTDFRAGVEFYLAQIRKYSKADKSIFLCTEDPEYKDKILSLYPKVIVRERKFYTTRNDPAKEWSDPASYENNVDRMKEAVEDLFLLAKTNIKIYHHGSTFCQIARILSGEQNV